MTKTILVNKYHKGDFYTPKELMAGAGISTALYNQWLYRNLFSATKEAEGSGTISLYIFDDILVVSLIILLRRLDIRLKRASKIAKEAVKEFNGWQVKNQLSVSDRLPCLYIELEGEQFIIRVANSRNPTIAIMIDIENVAKGIRDKIDAM